MAIVCCGCVYLSKLFEKWWKIFSNCQLRPCAAAPERLSELIYWFPLKYHCDSLEVRFFALPKKLTYFCWPMLQEPVSVMAVLSHPADWQRSGLSMHFNGHINIALMITCSMSWFRWWLVVRDLKFHWCCYCWLTCPLNTQPVRILRMCEEESASCNQRHLQSTIKKYLWICISPRNKRRLVVFYN